MAYVLKIKSLGQKLKKIKIINYFGKLTDKYVHDSRSMKCSCLCQYLILNNIFTCR